MTKRSPPGSHYRSEADLRAIRHAPLQGHEGIERTPIDQDLETLLTSKAVRNNVALDDDDMAGDTARSHPREASSSAMASKAASSSTGPFAQRREELRTQLVASAPSPTAAEQILFDLASHEVAVYLELSEAQEKLTLQLTRAVNGDVREAFVLSKVLREVTQISGVIGRRVEHVLTTATALRAQRRFLELHGGRDET